MVELLSFPVLGHLLRASGSSGAGQISILIFFSVLLALLVAVAAQNFTTPWSWTASGK
jgi:hypothetical protein